MVEPTGQEMLQDFLSVYAGPQPEADAIGRWVERQYLWMADALTGAGGARSINRLSRGRREYTEFRALLDAVPSARIIDAYLETVGSYTEGAPLRVRLGIYDQPKQGIVTDDVWDGVMPRGAFRPFEPAESRRMFLVVSKILGGPVVLPGPTEVVRPKKTPDEAVKHVLERLAKVAGAGVPVEIIGLEQLDEFDAALADCRIYTAERLPIAYRLPTLMREAGLAAPAALKLPSIRSLPTPLIGGGPLDRLRVKRNASDWHEVRELEIAGRRYRLRCSPELRVTVDAPGMGFTARIVHVEDITPDEARAGRPLEAHKLVAVLAARDAEHAGDLAAAVLCARDDEQEIRTFLEHRKLARVLRGEFPNRGTLATDRAFAGVAFAARRLEDFTATVRA